MHETPIQLTEQQKKIIHKLPLFRGLSETSKKQLWSKLDYQVFYIPKGEIIVKQNSPCIFLYILLKGNLEVNIIDITGNNIKIENIVAPRSFATPHLFSANNIFPATFTTTEECILFKATKDSVFNIISSEPEVLKTFFKLTGNCNSCTTNRLKILSYKSIRSRFIFYLFEHRTDDNTSMMEHNQTQLSEYMTVSRPALANEIKKLTEENLISVKGKIIQILNHQELMKYI